MVGFGYSFVVEKRYVLNFYQQDGGVSSCLGDHEKEDSVWLFPVAYYPCSEVGMTFLQYVLLSYGAESLQ